MAAFPSGSSRPTKARLARLTGVGGSKYSLKSVEYAKVPSHFTQILPEEGPPEPLDRGSYYVFQIERQSGSVSYQAVKVLADGSLQAYNAQPRAGSSYLLCCNVTADFPEPVILPDATQNAGTDNGTPDQSPDDSGAPPEESGSLLPGDPNAPAIDPNAPPSLP